MWLQPRCGYPYEHEPEMRAALQDFASLQGVTLGEAKQLKVLNPKLLRDAGYGLGKTDHGTGGLWAGLLRYLPWARR